MAAFAAFALTLVGVRRSDGRVVLVGTAFTVMAALLAIHGLATPGVVIGNNGVIALTGAATLPVGAAILSLSALPGSSSAAEGSGRSSVLQVVAPRRRRRPRRRRHGRRRTSFRPSPSPRARPRSFAMIVGVFFFAILLLRAVKTYLA